MTFFLVILTSLLISALTSVSMYIFITRKNVLNIENDYKEMTKDIKRKFETTSYNTIERMQKLYYTQDAKIEELEEIIKNIKNK